MFIKGYTIFICLLISVEKRSLMPIYLFPFTSFVLLFMSYFFLLFSTFVMMGRGPFIGAVTESTDVMESYIVGSM